MPTVADDRHAAQELADGLRALLSIEEPYDFPASWAAARKAAREALARYRPEGRDLTAELLRASRRLLYHLDELPRPHAQLLSAIDGLRAVVRSVEIEVVPVGCGGTSPSPKRSR